MGQLYQRGRIWWVKYYVNGRPVRESTGTAKEKEAGRFLKTREGRVAAGLPLLPRADRVRYEEAAADLREHYKTTGARDLEEADWRFTHLKRFFAWRRLADCSGALITSYVAERQAAGAANGTINRELAVFGRMLRLAYENGKLLRLPVIHKPKEAAPREGFFEREQFQAVRRRLPEDLQVAATIAYTFGWRTQSEVLTLERRQLDLKAGTLRLDPGATKNDDGRVVYLTPELRTLLAAQLERVEQLAKQTGAIIPYLFAHLGGRHRGQRRDDYRKAWATACRRAGVAGRLRHDFRRTAVRNMVNAGVPERVAMTVTGHRTRAVFDRYHIVSPGDLQDVARRLAGTIPGTIEGAGLTGVSQVGRLQGLDD
jgi:integrase